MSSEYRNQTDLIIGERRILESGTRKWAILQCVLLVAVGLGISIGSGMQLLADRGHNFMQHSRAMMALPGSMIMLGVGLLMGLSAIRGYPRIFVSARGVRLEGNLGKRSANWKDLGPFESSHRGRAVTAEIWPNSHEPALPAAQRAKFVLPAIGTDTGKLSIMLNAMRTGQSAGN